MQLAAGATRELTFRLDPVGNFSYWGALKGRRRSMNGGSTRSSPARSSSTRPAPIRHGDRTHLPHHASGSTIPDRAFESALTFNGKAWPYNERLDVPAGRSVHFRFINAAAVEHPLHLHGFYFRVERHGGARATPSLLRRCSRCRTCASFHRRTLLLSFVPTTPGNWVFHCHFASHVGEP